MKKKKGLLKVPVVTTGILYFMNRWIDSTSIKKQASSKTGSYYHWKNGDVYYTKTGNGNPLLLLHDMTPYSSSYEWKELIHALKDEFTLYLVDLPGCGKSEKPAITFTNYYFVQFITDFIRDVIKEPAHVAATGLTGSSVIMANCMDDNLFKSITLINLPSLSQLKKVPNRRSKLIQFLFDLPVIGTSAYYFMTCRANIENRLTEKILFNPFYVEPWMIKASYDASHAGNGFGKYLMGSLLGNYVNVDISKALSETVTPIHLIYGEHNPQYHQAITEYRALNENLTAEIIPECGQCPQFEVIDDILESFYTYIY